MQDIEITKVKRGPAYPRSGYIIKGVPGRTIYGSYDEAHAAAQAMPEPTRPTQSQPTPTRRETPRRDRQATSVAAAAGMPAPRPTGRCHYCGLPLTGGECEECI